jgi:AcrR family transcriptional regulator
MREAILAAVDELVRDRGWQATTMSDVATRAGVSRPTVYQLFDSRGGLAQAYLLHQTELFLGSVEDAIRADAADPFAAVTAGFHTFLAGAADNGMVKAILTGEDNDGLLPLVTTRSLPVIGFATGRLVALIDELWPRLSRRDVEVFAESVVRLAISHATAVGHAPEHAVSDVTHLLHPFIERAFASASAVE